MELYNKTNLVARQFTGGLGENVNAAWVVARRTYRLNALGDAMETAPSGEQWPIFVEPLETEFGIFPADDYPFRAKAEAIVVGTARSRHAVTYLQPQLQVGRFVDRLIVFGDRRWVKRGEELVASAPERFTEMDLGPKSAFGGAGQYADEPVPHPLNPLGKGFYLSAVEAEGRPLPNLESAESPIRRWNDQPSIATWGLVPNGALWQMAEWIQARKRTNAPPPQNEQEEARLEQEAAAQANDVFPTAAPPRLLIDAIAPGDAVALDLGDEKIRFQIPTPAPVLSVVVGARSFKATVRPIAVWILVPKRLVVLTWMARYRYGLRPRENRESFLTRG